MASSEPPNSMQSNSARDLYYNNPLAASPTTQARKVLAERGELMLSAATTTDDDDVDNLALYTEFVLSDNESEDEDDELREFTQQPPQQEDDNVRLSPLIAQREISGLPPPPPPPPVQSIRASSMSSPRESRKTRHHVDALLVDDKPWRSGHRKTPHFKPQPAPPTPSTPPQPHRHSLLGFIGGGGGRTTSETNLAADDHETDDGDDYQHHHNQDLVVEAVSQPSSDGSSYGGGDDDSNSQDQFWNDLLPPDDTTAEFGWERPVSFETMAEDPSQPHFCPTGTYGQLGSSGAASAGSPPAAVATFSHKRASHFVWQQGMLLHAALQLLVERDHLGVEGNMDASDNVWKKGPLKKWATGKGPNKWKVKYVEVRKGNIVYYDDGSESQRKSIHLRSSDTIVAAVVPDTSAKHVFEIVQTGSPKFLFMARSEDDCQAWITAIQAAMIGNNNYMDTCSDMDESGVDTIAQTHESAIGRYKALQARLIMVDTHDDYVSNVKEALLSSDTSVLRIPVSWIRQQVQDLGGKGYYKGDDRFKPTFTSTTKGNSSDPQKLIRASISEFLSNLRDTAFAVNGHVIPLEAPFSAERVFGALTRCILEYDHAFVQESNVEHEPSVISELQAVSYVYDILVAVLRTREQQDVLYAVNDLLRNDDLVVLSAVPDEEIIHLEVSFAGDDWREPAGDPLAGQLTTWLRTRKKGSPGWRRRFAVLSGVVLSYFESATPRPHGLKGQLVLDGTSKVTMLENETDNWRLEGERWAILISTKDETRYLGFETEEEMTEWNAALKEVVKSCNTNADDDPAAQPYKFRWPMKGGGKKMFNFARSFRPKNEHSSGATTPSAEPLLHNLESPATTTPVIPATAPARPSMNMLMQQKVASGKREPTVQCVAQHVHQFVVKDRFDDSQILFSVHAKLFQAFMCSGGGSLSQGNNTLVEIVVVSNK